MRSFLVVVLALCVATAVRAQTLVKADDGTGLHIYFRTAWTAPHIHFSQGSGWTAVPGILMTRSTDQVRFPPSEGWFKYVLPPPASFLEFVFNNGQGTWENNNNANYRVSSAGYWGITTRVTTPPSRPACWTWNGLDSCPATSNDAPASEEIRRWQTPPRNVGNWSLEFQDYHSLQGYAHVVYDSSRLAADVTARTFLRVPTSEANCVYFFNNVAQSSPTFRATSALMSELLVRVECTRLATGDKWILGLDPVYFVWQNTPVPVNPAFENGQKGAVVDLFGWPWKDIEAECRDFLGKAGYMGVKVSPPQESLMSDKWTADDQRNPWYFFYQPVSYRLFSRMGSRSELRSMIQTCRANGVRVYADAIINHMVGEGNDVNPRHRNSAGGSCATWSEKSSTKGSPYFTHSFAYEANPYTGERPALEFPAVPFGPTDFHCQLVADDETDFRKLEVGWLLGLADLNTKKPYVRERIAQYLIDLMGIGFSGFRIDAYKHLGPTDSAAIMGIFNTYLGGSLPDDFVMWGEVIIKPEWKDFLACNANSGYDYYKGLDALYSANGISTADIEKLKIWSSDYPANYPICGTWVLPPSRLVVQNDDHDQQPADSSTRPMGSLGSVLVKEKNVDLHRSFNLKLFNDRVNDWKLKVVLSSFTFGIDGAFGIPDGFSDCKGMAVNAPSVCRKTTVFEPAFRAGSCGYTVEGFAGGKWTRVHRDLATVNAMRAWIGLPSVTKADVGITSTAC